MILYPVFFSSILIFQLLISNTTPTTTTSCQTEKILPSDITQITYITNTYKDDIETFHGYYSYPFFPLQLQQSEKLNQFYSNQFFEDYKEIQNIRDSADILTLPPNTVYAYDHTFEVTFQSNNFLSILENTYTYAGGVHPESTYEAHTFSLKSGKELKLEDLFLLSKSKIEKKIKNIIISSIQKTPEDFFPDAIQIVSDMSLDSFHFYINHNGINIFFNTYEITPYAKGYVEFPI